MIVPEILERDRQALDWLRDPVGVVEPSNVAELAVCERSGAVSFGADARWVFLRLHHVLRLRRPGTPDRLMVVDSLTPRLSGEGFVVRAFLARKADLVTDLISGAAA